MALGSCGVETWRQMQYLDHPDYLDKLDQQEQPDKPDKPNHPDHLDQKLNRSTEIILSNPAAVPY